MLSFSPSLVLPYFTHFLTLLLLSTKCPHALFVLVNDRLYFVSLTVAGPSILFLSLLLLSAGLVSEGRNRLDSTR